MLAFVSSKCANIAPVPTPCKTCPDTGYLTPRYSTKASLCPTVHLVLRALPPARVPRRRPGFTDTVQVLLPGSIADRRPLLHSRDSPGGSLRWLSREPSLPLDAHAPPPRAVGTTTTVSSSARCCCVLCCYCFGGCSPPLVFRSSSSNDNGVDLLRTTTTTSSSSVFFEKTNGEREERLCGR